MTDYAFEDDTSSTLGATLAPYGFHLVPQGNEGYALYECSLDSFRTLLPGLARRMDLQVDCVDAVVEKREDRVLVTIEGITLAELLDGAGLALPARANDLAEIAKLLALALPTYQD